MVPFTGGIRGAAIYRYRMVCKDVKIGVGIYGVEGLDLGFGVSRTYLPDQGRRVSRPNVGF